MKKDEFDNIYGELHLLEPSDHINIDRIGNELYNSFLETIIQNASTVAADYVHRVKQLEENFEYDSKIMKKQAEDALYILEEKYESVLHDIRSEYTKKSDGINSSAFVFDIDNAFNMDDINAIRFT